MRPTSISSTTEQSRYWASNRDWVDEIPSERYPLPVNICNWPPMTQSIRCGLPPIVLNSLRTLSLLKKEPLWLAKDGLFPLISFFQRFQIPPEDFKSKILIHVKWNEIIPEVWRRHCLSYHLASVDSFYSPFPGFSRPEPKEIIFTGFLHDDYCSLNYLESRLAYFSRKKQTKDLLKYGNIFWAQDSHGAPGKYSMEFFSIVRSFCKGDLEFKDLGGLSFSGDLGTSLLIDINERLICADDSPTNILLSRGARMPKVYKIPKGTQMVMRSPYHALFFYTPPYLAPSFLDSPDFMELKHYLEVSNGLDKDFGISLGVCSEWIRRLHSFKEKLSSLP